MRKGNVRLPEGEESERRELKTIAGNYVGKCPKLEEGTEYKIAGS